MKVLKLIIGHDIARSRLVDYLQTIHTPDLACTLPYYHEDLIKGSSGRTTAHPGTLMTHLRNIDISEEQFLHTLSQSISLPFHHTAK
jgi:hypothetical protein